MPYPNEHAYRINNPDKYDKLRRENDKLGAGIDVIFGVLPNGKTEVQAIRFDKSKFTSEQAKTWLKDHDYSGGNFEEASIKNEYDIEEKKSIEVSVLKANDEKKLIYGIALKPDVPDAHDDIISNEEIQKSAHDYLMFRRNTGIQHEEEAQALICESYITPLDMTIDNKTIKKGTWIICMKIFDNDLWLKVKQGDYKAFSVGGYARKIKE